MSVDPLSSLSAHLARLRAELAERNGKPRRKGNAGEDDEPVSGPAAEERERLRPDARALRATVEDIVRNGKCDDAAGRSAVRGRIVKAILIWEFGQALREYPEWQSMVETIIRTMDSDDRASAAFDRMIDDVSGGSRFKKKTR